MVVGLSVPASAFFVNSPTVLMAADAPAQAEGQIITSDAAGAADVVEYDTWGVASQAELRQASTIRVDKSYTVDNSGAVRWPFPVAVPISDGFGARVSPCSGCSTQHKGTDFTPGIGTAISAIADGVVSQKTTSAWGFGYHVYIDHVINGKKVTSVYAHMLLGSSDLDVGDVVKAGDFVGLVGQTGAATGPHLHLEIRVEGVQVDPFLWLKVNAGE
jgi:murein DD-endopeptidase MepM/ murein hydrolase activator NlpD